MPFQRDAGVHVKKKACLARDPEELLTCMPSTASAGWPLQGWLRNQVHIHSKRSIEKPGSDMDCSEARDYVSCNTVQAQLPSHWWLAVGVRWGRRHSSCYGVPGR